MFAQSGTVIQARAGMAACVSEGLQQCPQCVRVQSIAGRAAEQRDATGSDESEPMCAVGLDRKCSGMQVASCADAALELCRASAGRSHRRRLHRDEQVGSVTSKSIGWAAKPVAAPLISSESIACTAASRAGRTGQRLMVPPDGGGAGAAGSVPLALSRWAVRTAILNHGTLTACERAVPEPRSVVRWSLWKERYITSRIGDARKKNSMFGHAITAT